MANKKDIQSSGGRYKKERRMDAVVFVLLAIGAVAMVFPLIYMICASFMTRNQILSADFSLIPNPVKHGKYLEVLSNNFKSFMCFDPLIFWGGGHIHGIWNFPG